MPRAPKQGGIHSDGIRKLIKDDCCFNTNIEELENGYVVRIVSEKQSLILSKHFPAEPRIFSTMDAVCSYCRRVGIKIFSVLLR